MADRELWNLLGRGTPAGRALFNVYSGDTSGKRAGSDFHERNRKSHERRQAEGWKPPNISDVQPKARATRKTVSVPKVGRGGSHGNSSELQDERGRTYFHYYLYRGGKRSGADIIREMEAEWANAPMQRMPTRPVLDDAEKDRLANLMRWRGKAPEVTEEEVAAQRRTRRAEATKTRIQELEEMFDQTVAEIDERRAFLEDMRSKGTVGKYDRQIQAEIHQRVADLKKIDSMIGAEKGKAGAEQ